MTTKHLRARRGAVLKPILVAVALFAPHVVLAPAANAADFAATASVDVRTQFVGDVGKDFRFTVTNTGTANSIAAVLISR
ncbi:MAG TPA: hypothetical protein VHF91_10740, partial [Acidimicrobiales bacterium]|nr:hypothetical protein [Acidimicrobiales bacterium]